MNKTTSSLEILSVISKNQKTRQRLLKQLQQLDIDIKEYEQMPLSEILLKVAGILKNTYSIKYLGLNQNEMGVISRRVNPSNKLNFTLADPQPSLFMVSKYFYPKPLKVLHRVAEENKINLQNLQPSIKKVFDENASNRHTVTRGRKKVNGSWLTIPKILKRVEREKRSCEGENGNLIVLATMI